MSTWEDVILKAKELADAAGRKVCDAADVTKQKLKIAENERSIRVALEALGGMLYESRKEGVILNEDLATELIAQVDELTAANEQLQDQLDNRRGCKVCACGAKNPEAAVFCNTCGEKL